MVSHGGNCVELVCKKDDKISVHKPENFQGNHEEADTLLIFHASQCYGNVVIRSSDTDVIVLLLGMLGRHKDNHTITLY